MRDIPEAAIRSSAQFARTMAKQSRHTEAVSECCHCNLNFLATWAENLLVGETGWSQQPPTEQGDYWHWTGNPDDAPFIHHVMWSGTAQKCFISKATISTTPFCDEYGGWWKRIVQPQTPQVG